VGCSAIAYPLFGRNGGAQAIRGDAGPGDGGGSDPVAGLLGDGGPGFLGGGDGGGGDGGGQAVHGRAMSRGETDSYGLGLQARGEGDQARGRLAFGHRADSGREGFAGEITCLSVGEDGVVQVSGTTREGRGHQHGRRGEKERDPSAGGEEGSQDGSGEQMAAGQDFAFTILTKSDPQQFSLPKLGDAGTLTPCGGGDTTTVAVTRGGFHAHR
ncbi:MAG: hypothetical protein ACRD0C_20425, partial [Acidimicrobiia bacterium]